MVGDFGVLSAVRLILKNDQRVGEYTQRIHLTVPPHKVYPLVILELEEIWSTIQLVGAPGAHTHIKFKVMILSEVPTPQESLIIARAIQVTLDGQTVELEQSTKGTLRFQRALCEHISQPSLCKVDQYYDVLIRS